MKNLLLLFIGWCSVASAASQSLDPGLVAWYRLDNNCTDSSPNKNDGTLQGNVQSASDRFGNPCGAMHFDGSTAYITVPNSPSLQSPVTALSVAVWFRLDKNSEGHRNVVVLSKGAQKPQYRAKMLQHFKEGVGTFSIGDKLTAPDKDYDNHLLETEKWYFLVLTYGDGWGYAFLDGKLTWQSIFREGLTLNDQPLDIGRDLYSATRYFAGCLDDLRIYNYALTPAQVKDLFNDASSKLQANDFSMKMPRDITLNTEKGQCYATVNFALPHVELSCGSYELKQLTGKAPGSAFSPGDNLIVFEATTADKSLTDSFHIRINDNDAPHLQCPANVTHPSADGQPVKVDYPQVTMTDNCPNAQLHLTTGLPSGSNFAVGTTPVIYTATDASGNTTECRFSVTIDNVPPPPVHEPAPVQPKAPPVTNPAVPEKPVKELPEKSKVIVSDKQAPAIEQKKKDTEAALRMICQTDIFKNNDPGKCGAVVNYQLPVLQNMPKAKTIQTTGLPSGSLFPIGNTANTFVASDGSGHSTECLFNVHIKDTEVPTLICPGDSFILLNAGRRGVIFQYQRPTATDNCPLDTLIQTEGSVSGCFLPVGTHPFAFEVHDPAGNVQHCSFTVTVQSGPETNQGVAPTFIDENLNIGNDTITYEHKVETKNCLLTVYMYDDGEEDNDTVSIVYNNQLIVNREMIRIKENGPIKRFVTLQSGQENYIAAKAWNTGKYGLNTLKIDVYEGFIENDKKELRGKKPVFSKVLHSRPGAAGGVILKCLW